MILCTIFCILELDYIIPFILNKLMRLNFLTLCLVLFSSLSFGQPTTWSPTTPYNKGEIVVEAGSSYVALQASTNQQPPNTTYWESLSDVAATLSISAEVLASLPTVTVASMLESLPGSTPADLNGSIGSTSVNLANLSTRGFVGTGDAQMIAGFVVSGTGSTTVTIRALGPTIAAAPFNVSGTISNPVLTIYDGNNNIVTSNDNYADHSSVSAVRASGKDNINSLEPAVQISVTPGNYSAVVSGANGATGVAIVEVYNENTSSTSVSLANLSTRGYVGSGDSQMIAGFVVSSSTTVTIRALGPTIAAAPFNVSGTISNPVLTIYDGNNNIVTSNDNYADHSSASAVRASGKDNINSLEPAVQISVTPGNYSAVVSGANGARGVAIVEVYDEGI